jgi:hypothetical protein
MMKPREKQRNRRENRKGENQRNPLVNQRVQRENQRNPLVNQLVQRENQRNLRERQPYQRK